MIGAGAWGTALAQLAAANGDPVIIWARQSNVADAINKTHENPFYLPGVRLAPTLHATTSLDALRGCDALFVACPAQNMGDVLRDTPVDARPLVLCAKGIDGPTGRLMSEIAASIHPDAPLAVLSGPTFATEVGAGPADGCDAGDA